MAYVRLVERWNRAVGLVGGGMTANRLWGLVEETLAALPYLPSDGKLLDVGSGNGIPAIPLLVARPHLEGLLLEPRERRWAFLREMVRELRLHAEVRRDRLSSRVGSGFAVLTVRGVERSQWEDVAAAALVATGVVVWWTGGAMVKDPPRGGKMHVVRYPLPATGRGAFLVWSPCST
ncbi:MAG TPA: class I SAM-dependent methyltransferase [Thermoanaerobaculaceae bacterium]|nr:class I SAM-dependent methyltransferase [Thermoanaerobaculaceae bacterium]